LKRAACILLSTFNYVNATVMILAQRHNARINRARRTADRFKFSIKATLFRAPVE
jgi:hypothetical protein